MRIRVRAQQRITEDPVKTCPSCKAKKVRRLISRTAFVLKGAAGTRISTPARNPRRTRDRSATALGVGGVAERRSNPMRTLASKSESVSESKSESKPDAGPKPSGKERARASLRKPRSGRYVRPPSEGPLHDPAPRHPRRRRRQGARQTLRTQLAEEIAELAAAGHSAPCLAVVLVGETPPASRTSKGKRRACERVRNDFARTRSARRRDQEDVVDLVRSLNRDPHVDGILVQLPLPKPLQAAAGDPGDRPSKDVNGLHPEKPDACSRATGPAPAARRSASLKCSTAMGACARGRQRGRDRAQRGWSARPVALLLLERNSTVTICTRARATWPPSCARPTS